MGFFKKIFGRKDKTASPKNALPKPAAQPKQGRGRASKVPKKSTAPKVEEPVVPIKVEDEDLKRTPSFTATSASGRDSNFSREQTSNSPTNNHGTNKPLPTSTRSAPLVPAPSVKQPKSTRSAQSMPVDLDDTDFDESDHDGPAGLSFHQLQKFNMQNQMQTPHQLYNMNDPHRGKKSLLEVESESSQSLNLSTDAEDEEYNTMKKKGGSFTVISDSKKVDVSGLSSSLHYTTDEEGATVFPNLTDENPAASPGETGPMKIVSTGHNDSEEDMRAWGLVSPGNGQSTGSSGKENALSPRFHPHKKSFAPTNDDFANFATFDADFDNAFPGAATASDDAANQRSSKKRQNIVDGAAEERRSRPSSGSSRTEALTRSESLTDLLAQAKKVGGGRRSKGSSSVNSAPAITAQYLRQYHGLSRGDTKSQNDTSVSDIISSLEATNAARLQSRSAARSVGSRDSGANVSVRSAKDRIRERRRRDRERSQQRSASHVGASDESEDNDPSENWLFDEVTGALGPRGVAADMESLSGRSKSSAGNKSHKSHRSKGSTRRRQHRSSSGEEKSVDSRGSRNSRNSRYSHKSTRSYLSQMSEQSRSVANDLLRLEMQLAMVGSQENGEEGHIRSGGSVGASSVGGASRASRTSRNSSATRRSAAITKRSKIAVVAPPGKLGIILANKADSKGTVVSGVRTSSVLAEKISPGDRIIAIDGEDVSRMTVSEITTIMARKSEFERTLTVLTTPKHMTRTADTMIMDPEGSYSSFRR